jgi:hypothetical protein
VPVVSNDLRSLSGASGDQSLRWHREVGIDSMSYTLGIRLGKRHTKKSGWRLFFVA